MSIIPTLLSNWKNYLVIGLALSSLWFYSQYQSEKVTTATLEANNQTLKDSISKQDKTISYLRDQQSLMNSNISNLSSNNQFLQKEMSKKLSEINKLRAEANQNALENPYKAGNIATDGFNERLQSITTRSNKDSN